MLEANHPKSSANVDVKRSLAAAWALVNRTLDEYSKDRGDLLAAALAFYALLSLAPLIIVAVALAGLILGTGSARFEISRLMHDTMGSGAAQTVDGWVDEASHSGGVASVIGVLLSLFGASRLASQLRSALNQIWNVDVFIADTFKGSIKDYVKRRASALVMVLACGPLLLVIAASRAVLTGLGDVLFAGSPVAGLVVGLTQFVFSLALVAVLAAIVFKIVPDVHVGWRSVWIGALLTSVLFNLGNLLVGLYLARATVSATYGAAGSAVVVLLWIYFSAQFFLLGAEFTQVWAARGTRVTKPEPAPELGPEPAGPAHSRAGAPLAEDAARST
jgi:membrane protein